MHGGFFFYIGEKEEIWKRRKEVWAIGLENNVCERDGEKEPQTKKHMGCSFNFVSMDVQG